MIYLILVISLAGIVLGAVIVGVGTSILNINY